MATKTKIRLALSLLLSLMLALGTGLGWHLWRTSNADVIRAEQDHQHNPGVAHAQEKGGKQLHTCGMHPNVIQEGPGTCPICGMDLTPMKVGSGGTKKKGERKIKHWRAPMDPNYIRDKPGKSPMGMDLVPVYEDGEEGDAEGTVTVDPVMVQNMGVRISHVKEGSLSRRVRTIGEVVVAEDLVSVVNLKYSGWIEKLYVDQTGVKVRKGQRLFAVYSPELVSAQEEYLLAIRSSGGKESPLARSARTRLSFWDLGAGTLKRIEKRGKAMRTVTISAPRSGYVLHKNVVVGAKVNAGQDLFRIGKLDAVWVHAQVYEWDAPWIRLGQKASMELSFEKGRQYKGKVSYIYPTLNRKTRTLTVRLEFVNPQLQLKPGMFTTVWIETRQKSGVLTIPTEAIIHSGERNIVFVAQKEVGKYAPRQVVTGLAGDGHVTEIISGLEAGEAVVVSGQFLIDSESQLQEALQKLLASRLQIKGSTVNGRQSTEAGRLAPGPSQAKHGEKTEGPKAPTVSPGPTGPGRTANWTCPMHPTMAEDEAGECPICGMDLVKKKLK